MGISKEDKKKEFYNKAINYAKSRGGECLSTEYFTAKTKMKWKCSNQEHPFWESTYDVVVSKGSWCTKCGIEKNANKLVRVDGLIKAQEHARKKGGECLSTEYINARTKMKWRCSNPEHPEWESNFDHVVSRDRWCKQCAYDKAIIKDGYQQAVKYAKTRNGQCLSSPDTVVKSHVYLKWQCDNGHEPWEALFRNVVENNGWCPKCAGKFTPEEYIQKAKQLAIEKGGQCLSDTYENQNSVLEWQCRDATHPKFFAPFDDVEKRNKWCSICKANEQTPYRVKMLDKAKQHALSKKGKCLSKKFINTNEKLKWQCEKGHQWEAKYSNVVGILDRWCSKCAGQLSPEEMLEKAKSYAISRGGVCLSTKYITKGKLLWKCKEKNHKSWLSNINIISSGTWCHSCANSNYYRENNTRAILEYLLECSFQKSYEDWNINPKTNKRLELDGYNKEKNIAFEFQGRHHFQQIFKNSDLTDTQYKDKQKRINCNNNNVKLIEVIDRYEFKNIECLIRNIENILNEANILFKEQYDLDDLLSYVYEVNRTSDKEKRIEIAKEYAKSKGGVCLSDVYINYSSNLTWHCGNKEHDNWEASYGIINRKTWCPQCVGKKVKTTK